VHGRRFCHCGAVDYADLRLGLIQIREKAVAAGRGAARRSPGTIATSKCWSSISQEDAMGFFTKEIKTMDDLFLHGLQDIYYAEQQITKALPKMIDKATNRDLVAGLKMHLEETNKQIERLDKVFLKLDKKPSGTQCPAIDGIIKEADELTGEVADKGCSTLRSWRAARQSSITRFADTEP
jgi:hypothetical protein